MDPALLRFSALPGLGLARLAASAPTVAQPAARAASKSRRGSRAALDLDAPDRSRASSGRSDGTQPATLGAGDTGTTNASARGRARYDSVTTASSFAEEAWSEMDGDPPAALPPSVLAMASLSLAHGASRSGTDALAGLGGELYASFGPKPSPAQPGRQSPNGHEQSIAPDAPSSHASIPIADRAHVAPAAMVGLAGTDPPDRREHSNSMLSNGSLVSGPATSDADAFSVDAAESLCPADAEARQAALSDEGILFPGFAPSTSVAESLSALGVATALQSEVASISDFALTDGVDPLLVPPVAAAAAMLPPPPPPPPPETEVAVVVTQAAPMPTTGTVPRARTDLALPLVASVSMPPTPPRRMLALLTGLASDISLLHNTRPGQRDLCLYIQVRFLSLMCLWDHGGFSRSTFGVVKCVAQSREREG
jgi:hypothetical protein